MKRFIVLTSTALILIQSVPASSQFRDGGLAAQGGGAFVMIEDEGGPALTLEANLQLPSPLPNVYWGPSAEILWLDGAEVCTTGVPATCWGASPGQALVAGWRMQLSRKGAYVFTRPALMVLSSGGADALAVDLGLGGGFGYRTAGMSALTLELSGGAPLTALPGGWVKLMIGVSRRFGTAKPPQAERDA